MSRIVKRYWHSALAIWISMLTTIFWFGSNGEEFSAIPLIILWGFITVVLVMDILIPSKE